jgi:hypothetical protein
MGQRNPVRAEVFGGSAVDRPGWRYKEEERWVVAMRGGQGQAGVPWYRSAGARLGRLAMMDEDRWKIGELRAIRGVERMDRGRHDHQEVSTS